LIDEYVGRAAQAGHGQLNPHGQAQSNEIQYMPHLIDGCLAGTGLEIEPW
jgi:hypothetical protein